MGCVELNSGGWAQASVEGLALGGGGLDTDSAPP